MRTPLLSLAFILLPVSAQAAPSASELFSQFQTISTPMAVSGEFHGEHRQSGILYSALWFSGESIPSDKKATFRTTVDLSFPAHLLRDFPGVHHSTSSGASAMNRWGCNAAEPYWFMMTMPRRRYSPTSYSSV